MFWFIKNFIETFKQDSLYYKWLSEVVKINKSITNYKDINRDTLYKMIYPVLHDAHINLDENNINFLCKDYWHDTRISIKDEVDRAINLASFFYGDSEQLHNIINKNQSFKEYYSNPSTLYEDIKGCGVPKSYSTLYDHFTRYFDYLKSQLDSSITSMIYNIWVKKRVLQLLITISEKFGKEISLKDIHLDRICILSPIKNNLDSLISYIQSITVKQLQKILVDDPRSKSSYNSLIDFIIEHGINMVIEGQYNSYGIYDESLYMFLAIYTWMDKTTFIVPYGNNGTVFFCGAYSKNDMMFIVYNRKNNIQENAYQYTAQNIYKVTTNSNIPFIKVLSIMAKENWTHIIRQYFSKGENINKIGGMYKLSLIKHNNDPVGMTIINNADVRGKHKNTEEDFVKVNYCFPNIVYNGRLTDLISEINYYYNTTFFIEPIPSSILQSLVSL